MAADPARWRAGLRLGLLAAALAGILGLGAWLAGSGHLWSLTDPDQLRSWLDRLGPYGWLALLVLLAVNVVVSPIPSGPILIATGAAYGPWLGSAIGLLGIQAGSLAAFLIARRLGAGAVRRLAGERALQTLEGSEMALAGIVLASRIVPFVSFDMVSWAAGLTPLRIWLFAGANLLGILPMTILLVLAGAGVFAADREGLFVAGGAIVLMLALTAFWARSYLAPRRFP